MKGNAVPRYRAPDERTPVFTGLEEATAEDPMARRALRLGFWAGKRLGYAEGRLALYAFALMDAVAGGACAVARVSRDFAARGLSFDTADLRARMAPPPALARLAIAR